MRPVSRRVPAERYPSAQWEDIDRPETVQRLWSMCRRVSHGSHKSADSASESDSSTETTIFRSSTPAQPANARSDRLPVRHRMPTQAKPEALERALTSEAWKRKGGEPNAVRKRLVRTRRRPGERKSLSLLSILPVVASQMVGLRCGILSPSLRAGGISTVWCRPELPDAASLSS